MALTVNSYSTVAASNGISVVITKPSGLVVGDIMFAFIMNENGVSAAPSGWTLIAPASIDRTNVYYIIATATEVAATDFTWTINSGAFGGVITRTSAPFNISSPYQVSATTVSTTATPSFAIGLTPATADSLLLFYTGYRYSGGTTATMSGQAIATSNPSWTEIYDSSVTAGQKFGAAVAWASRNAVTATGNATVTYTATCDVTMGVLIVVRPSYTIAISESLTLTETKKINTLLYVREVLSLVELFSNIKGRLWRTITKPITIWRKYNK